MLFASASLGIAAPQAVNPHWHVTFPAAATGKAAESTAVSTTDDSTLVAVVSPGADGQKPGLFIGNQKIPAQVLGIDPVSRLEFLKVTGPLKPRSAAWLDSATDILNKPLQAPTTNGIVKCRATQWVKQVSGKIQPFALLSVKFDQAVPFPGTPLLDDSGRIAAIVFQRSDKESIGYAIPAEAVHRVQMDVIKDGALIRGWLGLALLPENAAPKIVRVIPGSPAAKARIQAGDVLSSIGFRKISDYADAANAFFYLKPGQAVEIKLKRGANTLTYSLTPSLPPAER